MSLVWARLAGEMTGEMTSSTGMYRLHREAPICEPLSEVALYNTLRYSFLNLCIVRRITVPSDLSKNATVYFELLLWTKADFGFGLPPPLSLQCVPCVWRTTFAVHSPTFCEFTQFSSAHNPVKCFRHWPNAPVRLTAVQAAVQMKF